MPELPEVQTTVNGIKEHTIGMVIRDVWTNYNSSFYAGKDNIKNPKYFSLFKKQIIDSKIIGADRRAKNVLINLSCGKTILIHMKMTGHLLYGNYSYDKKTKTWRAKQAGSLQHPLNQFIRLVLTLSNNKHLVLSDMRRFAKVTLIDSKGLEEHKDIHILGPEPLEDNFTFNILKGCLNKKSGGRIKTVLMNQKVIAGIGNIYSDEILWRAGVHPEERVKNIPETKLKLIFKAIKDTLKKGIDLGGDSMSDYHNILGEKGLFQNTHTVYRRTGLSCLKRGCSGTIQRKKVGGRSAHFCPVCQTLLHK
ncbi:MAG: bifunctional DNA-formamidopyrimidine glycosylase/DNA-(apurinic or apyrimidinic site) lyase [Candidatus Paceibacterota bacterium]|jgi:formamidopyrimidine-DNA glycosylase